LKVLPVVKLDGVAVGTAAASDADVVIVIGDKAAALTRDQLVEIAAAAGVRLSRSRKTAEETHVVAEEMSDIAPTNYYEATPMVPRPDPAPGMPDIPPFMKRAKDEAAA
jgi:hypothetical protein